MKNYKLVVLFAQYGNEQYPDAHKDLDNFLKDINCSKQKIIIDNKTACDYDYVFPNGNIYIQGDNSAWEFSAWDKGLKYVKDLNVEYDAILFVNSSFMNSRIKGIGGNPKTVINNESIRLCIEDNKAIFPWLTTGDKYFKLDNNDVSSWYRTNCFLLNKNHINVLQFIQTYDIIYLDKFINKEISDNYFKADAPMNKILKDFIIWRLTESWHNPIDIKESWSLFKMKTLGYFNEFGLTARLRNCKINVISEQ